MGSFLAAGNSATPGMRIVSNRYGVPKLFLRDGGPLSAPSTADQEQTAKDFLLSHAALFPFAPSEVDNLRVVVKDVTGGATFVAFNQTFAGIDVFEGQIKFTLSRAGEVVQVAAGEVAPGINLSATPRLSPEDGVRAAFASIGVKAPGALTRQADAEGRVRFLNPRGGHFNPIAAELSIFPLTAASARLAYRILLDADERSYYEILIAADDGSVLYRHNLYVHAGQATVWTQSPLVGERQVVTLPPSSNPFPDPWLPGLLARPVG
jgi:Zn-dependent metalloprotease